MFLVGDSRPPAWAAAVTAALGAELQPMGSAGAKAMTVLRGAANAYQWEWDSAAPVGVAPAAGLHASRVDGTELCYNSEHPYLPNLIICRADIAPSVLEQIAESR